MTLCIQQFLIRLLRLSTLAAALVGFTAVPSAQAQGGGFVGGLAGITFASESSSVFAGQAGGRVARQWFIFGEFGRMQNVLPEDAQDDLDEATEFLESQLGTTVDLDVRVPAIYGLAGIRWSPEDRIAPFLEAGAGFARLSVDLTAEIAGTDVTDEIEDQLDREDLEVTDFLLAFGGGLNARLSERIRLDVGYRYNRVFTDDPEVTVSVAYAALKFWF
jgi:hypothetical protein